MVESLRIAAERVNPQVATDIPEIWSVTAYWIQALAALFGLCFIGWQVQQARKTSDLGTLQAFLKEVAGHERDILRSETAAQQEESFVAFLNFLEVYAAAFNDGLLAKSSKKVIRLKLISALATIQSLPDWHPKLEDAISSPDTFEEVGKFFKKNKKAISDLSRAMQIRTDA